MREPQYANLASKVGGRADLYAQFGHAQSFKGITFGSHHFSIYRGENNVSKWIISKEAKATALSNWPQELGVGNTREEALTAFKDYLDKKAGQSVEEGDESAIKFSIYSRRGSSVFIIGKKVGKNHVDLKTFSDVKAARAFLQDHHAELVKLLEKAKEIPAIRRTTNSPRVGEDHRDGADVTPQQFSESFGFRGVQFGNYVEGKRRQADLNEAYDALMDLAGVIDIPPKALSLNGTLGLAFGARGKGGKNAASAHYEPDTVVINLTKANGAGSLAHEWFHAVDNFFSRQRNDTLGHITDKPYERGEGVRPEMVSAFKEVMRAINFTRMQERSKNLDGRRSKGYWSLGHEMAARAFESYTIAKLRDQNAANDYLANIVSEEGFDIEDGYPYPTAAEIPQVRAAFDHFFKTVETRETDNGVDLFNVAGSTKITPADKAIYGMATEGKNAKEVLGFIAGASRSLFNRHLARALIQTELATSITVGDGRGWKFNAGEGKYAAAYNPATDTAALFRPAAAERNVLHECMHAATLKALSKRGLAATQMRRLYEFVKKSGKVRGQYGMTNVDEFVAEAFTNPKFQQALMRINAPDLTGFEKKNAWHWFVRLVRNILGLKSGSHDALSQALMLGTRLMHENMHKEIPPAAQWVDSTVRSDGIDPTSIRSAEDLPNVVKTGQRSNTETAAVYAIDPGRGRPNEPLLIDGIPDIAMLPAEISARTKGRFAAKPIRLMYGRHFGTHRGFGFAHIKAEHESEIPGSDPLKAAMYTVNVVRNTTKIYDNGRGRLMLQSVGMPKGTAIVELIDHGDFYSIVTVFDGKPEGRLVWSGRRLHLSSKGSGDMDSSMTTTAEQSGSPSARTAQLPANPKQPLETLANQTSGSNIDENRIRYNVVGDSGRPYDAGQREFFKNVGRDVNPVSRAQSVIDYLKTDFFKKMAVGMVDQFRGLRDLKDNGQAYLLARLSKGTAGTFEAFLNHGKLSINDGVYDSDTSGGFVERLGVPLHGELDDFLWWVAANRAEGLKTESASIRAEGARLLSQAETLDSLAKEKTLQAERVLQQAGDFPKSMLGNQRAQKANADQAKALFMEAKALRSAAIEARKEGNAKKDVERERLFSDDDIAAGKTLASGQTNFDYTLQTGPSKGKITRSRAAIYQDAHRVFNEFQKNALDMAEQSGLIDGSTRKYWESDFYVPFYRVSEEEGEFVGAKMGNSLVRQQAFKQLKGGTDKLNSDLLSNTLLNWAHLIEAGAKNRAAKAALEAAEKCGAAHRAATGEKQTVWHMENGKKVEYGVDDPFVLTAITSLEYAGMRNGIMDVMSKFKHWLTIGVTASPAFKVRNLIRDSLQAIGTSELGYNPVKNIKEGWKLTKGESQTYVSALASGGLIRFGTMLEGSESSRIRHLIRSGVKDSSILDSEGKWRAFYTKYLEPGIAAYNELGNRSEEINRVALYDQLVKQGKSHAEAALMARDLMDFSMQGSFNTIRFLTQVTPFLNARMQGMYKLGRTVKDNPRKLAIVTGAVAVASIGLMLAYGDDDDWKRREDWDRDNYFWFKFAGQEFRIPKPFEVGAVATLAERSFEYVLDDEMTGERFRRVVWDLLWNNLSMNPTPQVFKPIIDLYANEDSFTNRPIETQGMQRLEKEMRYNSGTSMVARGLSTATLGALSPVQYDFLVRSYFSWLGASVVGGADMAVRALSDEPTQPALDYFKFATQGIVREQGTGRSRYVSMLYRQAEELERAYATYRQLLKDGKREEAANYASDNADKLKRYKQVERVKKTETLLNSRIRFIERSDMDSGEKRAQINALQQRKAQAARSIAPGI